MKRGKRYKVVKRNLAVGMLLAMLNSMLFADIKVDRNIPQKTSVDRAQNGANIININTPNQKGISVNDFSEFRTKDPTVFNNFGSGVGRSYLAGMMASNPNLTKEQAARLILNRVGGNNRVEIENWLEVMSENKTDLIFSANQGFYLNNTGFINFDKVIFTTSRVDLDGNGDLLPFNIRGGKIEIGREGINAEGVRYLAFLSKQISIDGQIYAKDADVDLIAGDFDYNPNTKEYTKQGINNNELLISSSAFGSMYGNQIKIVAVNGNVGVAGDNIAQKVLKINADGTIITNKNQGNEGIEIKGKEFTQNSSTYTEGNLTIEADKVTLKGNGTQAGNILITGELENEVNIYSGADINIGKGLLNKSGQIVAERNISIGGKVDNRDLLYAKNNITIGKELNNTGNIQSNGNIKAGGNTTNIGKILSENELTVDGKLTSTGTIYGKNKVEVKDKLDNSGDIQSEGNISVGSDTKNTGRIISDKNIEISGNLETEETVYAKENLNVKGNLLNKKDIQAEGNITVEKDTINQGRLLSDKELKIKGNTNNSGTLYGKDRISLDKNLTNTGTIQTSGDLTAKDTVNTGKIVSEGNVSLNSFDNSGELTINKKLTTTTLENKTGAKINTGEGIQSNGVRNYGEINSNSNFLISGNLENYNIMNIGGLLTANDLLNTGNLKAVEKIYTSGISFNNSGEILTTLLDINNTGILNTNKITVIDDARLNGSNVTNNGYISGTNIEIITAGITNTGTLAADGLIKVNNTTINNTGYIGSNTKVNLSGSNLINSGVIESSEIELYNMSGYNNLNLIRGGNVSLTTTGNINLTGTLHGENWLQIHGYNILNAGATTGTGYIEIKGRDITNNTELASNTVVIEGTGNITNNNIITGENGRISGNNIVNNDLIAFSDQLGLTAADKITNNAGKAIYGGNLLDVQFNTLENLSGELLSTGLINLRGNYLLNQTGMIQSSGDIALNVTKIDNIGSVKDLDKYEIYYETWDGQILTEAEALATWNLYRDDSAGTKGNRRDKIPNLISDPTYNSLLIHYYQSTIFSDINNNDSGSAYSNTAQYQGIPLKGKLRSKAITTYANISAGNNIQVTANELNNKDGKISAGNTAELTAPIIKNETTLGNQIQLKDGREYFTWSKKKSSTGKTSYPIKYYRDMVNGDIAYVAGQASVIEARNLVINTGSLILTTELPTIDQIINGSTTSGGSVTGKTVNTGSSNGTGMINIIKNITPVTEIIISGILPIDPLGAVSSLFTMTKAPDGNNITQGDSTSKYLIETRSKYINLSDFYGSDYYLSRIGYDENSDWNNARRLGDAYYEYLLITRTLSDKLGTRFINGLSDKELMKAMLDNSVELQKDLQLSVGVALTPDQVKALKSDIIWYEYEVVNGEKVLVPKVYLSQATLATIDTDGRNKVGGLELTAINADELRNNGQVIGNGGVTYVNAGRVYNVTNTNELAEIKGNEVTVIATAGNIENIGGRIKGIDSVTLSAENGDIINSSSIRTVSYDNGDLNRTRHDEIVSAGSIESEGTTYIEGKNYISEAGMVSGKTTVINAQENITIGSMTLQGDDKYGSDNDNYQAYQSTRKIGSEITGTEAVILEAGKDITVKGSVIGSDGLVQLTAENINILNEKESEYRETKNKSGNTFSNSSMEEKSYQEYAAASTIIGNNVILDAGNDINVRASNIIAVKEGLENTGGNISMTAGNNVNILVDTLDNSYSRKEQKSGFSTNLASGGGNFTAGVSYSQNSLEQQRNGTTAAVSTIVSEGNTVIDAGNRVKTEAMQANVGENLIIRGVNGVELLDAQEVYEEKIKQKSTSIGVSINVGFIPAQFANTVSNVSDNVKDYGFGNTSQSINTIGNGIQDLRDLGGLSSNLRSWYEGIGYTATKDILQHGNLSPDNLRNAAKGLVSASVSASYSQSSYESNTSGTNSVAGNINVGKNFILQSDGDVTLVNQKINVGENFVVDAKNFEVRAGENTYKNDTKSSSTGGNIGYDIVNQNMLGGLNVSGGNSNTSSKYYDNSVINVGGIFQLTTKEDALFAGVNVKADKINFDIGRDLSIISLQDEYKSDGKNWGAGLNVSGKLEGTQFETGSARPSLGGNYGENHQDSKWVNNQTTILAENGGNIKVGETLTNIGAVIGSLSDETKLSIEANKIVVENLKDHNEGSNYGINVSGIGIDKDSKTPIGQTGIQYGSHDKQQDSNATFVNTEVTEAGKKLNLEELGINTDINKAQIVTKDEVVDQIDVVLHTDLLNETTRNQVIRDINGLVQLPADIVRAIQATTENEGSNFLDNLVGTLRNTDANLIKYQEMNKQYKELKNLPDELKAENSKKLATDMANAVKTTYGIDEDVEIVINFTDQPKGDEIAAFVREDGKIEIYINVRDVDVSDMEQVYNALGAELNHYNPSNPYVYDKTEEQAGKGNIQEELFTSIGRKPLDGSGNSFYEEILNGSSTLESGNSQYSNIIEELLDFYHPSGHSASSEELNRRVREQNRYINTRKELEKSLETCSGKRCEYIYNKLAEIDGNYDAVKGIFYDGKQDTGDSPKTKNTGNNGTVAVQPKSTCGKACQERLAEEQRKKEEDDARKFLISLNQNDVSKDIIKDMMSNSGVDLEHNTYAFWKDNVECSGGSCKIYTGNLTDYNNARELERTQGWTNTEVILKRDIYSLGIVLSSEAILQGKTAEIYTSTIPGRMEGSKTGLLTYKDLYEANKISKEEYESTKGWSIGYQAAAWSEYVGPVVGGTSTYIAGKSGLLNQGIDNANNKKNNLIFDDKKYNYLFGEASPDPHNTPRSTQLNNSFGMRGIRNNKMGRQIIQEHFNLIINDSSNIIKTYQKNGQNFETRQSLLMTPSGKGMLLETSFEIMPDGSRRFVTTIPKN
jgi:filamentous hemagglutinin